MILDTAVARNNHKGHEIVADLASNIPIASLAQQKKTRANKRYFRCLTNEEMFGKTLEPEQAWSKIVDAIRPKVPRQHFSQFFPRTQAYYAYIWDEMIRVLCPRKCRHLVERYGSLILETVAGLEMNIKRIEWEFGDDDEEANVLEIDVGKHHDRSANYTTKSGIIEERLEHIDPQQTEWVWSGYIPAGRLVILAGDPGLGKSQIGIDLASRISRGTVMPGSDKRSQSLGRCAIATAEDHTAETIIPRIIAAGGDRTKIRVLRKIEIDGEKQYLSFPRDLQALHSYVIDNGLRLLVIDPFNPFLAAGTDTYKDHDVRLALGPLEEIAETTGCTILIIAHLNKKEDSATLYRVSGSIGFIGAARSVLAVSKNNNDENMRVMYSPKSNLSKRPSALQYTVDCNYASHNTHIVWHGLSDFNPEKTGRGDGPQKLKECLDFLREELLDGPVSSQTIASDARHAGIAMRTLNYYKSQLGVTATKRGDQWFWVPPVKWDKKR